MLARGLALLVFAAVAGCSSTLIPNNPIEPPLTSLIVNEPRNIALSPFRIQTNQGTRAFVSTVFRSQRPMEGWHAGREYPIATQTVTEELRSLGMRVFDSTEGLLAPGIRDTLDFLLSGTVQPLRFEIHDIPAGNYSEAQYRLNLKVVDARSGETVWEGESEAQGLLMNDPAIMSIWMHASISRIEDRLAHLLITNAFRSMIRGHSEELNRVFSLRAASRR
jgi:hypothetical protein